MLVCDPDPQTVLAITKFIHDRKLDLVDFKIVDTSDVSYIHDEIYAFSFSNEADAIMFRLRFNV